MSELEKDLNYYYDEAFNKKDIKAGIQLLAEVTGMITLGGLLISALFIWLPGIGIPVTTIAAIRCIAAATEAYSNLNTEERRQIRAVVRWVNGGIKLLD